jgi:hypothetical protein
MTSKQKQLILNEFNRVRRASRNGLLSDRQDGFYHGCTMALRWLMDEVLKSEFQKPATEKKTSSCKKRQ